MRSKAEIARRIKKNTDVARRGRKELKRLFPEFSNNIRLALLLQIMHQRNNSVNPTLYIDEDWYNAFKEKFKRYSEEYYELHKHLYRLDKEKILKIRVTTIHKNLQILAAERVINVEYHKSPTFHY